MSIMFWIAVILTSPFWFILAIIIIHYIFVAIGAVFVAILAIFDEFFKLFRRRKR